MENKEYVWCDKNHNYYKLEDISDNYLLNIINFISNGGGYVNEIDEEKITILYNEVDKRGLKTNHTLEELLNAFNKKAEMIQYVFPPYNQD